MTNLSDRLIERELARATKMEEHARKGKALGIGPEDHARLVHLFLRGQIPGDTFRGLLGEPLAERIRAEWRARVMGERPGPNS